MQLQNWATSTDWFFLAMTEHQLGHADAARRYYAKAIQWMNDHDPQNPELLAFVLKLSACSARRQKPRLKINYQLRPP